MIEIYKKTLKDVALARIEKSEKGSWVFVTGPTKKEIDFLVDDLHLERGHIMDALDRYEVPRFETEGNHIYVYLRFPVLEKESIPTMPVLFILTEDFIVTVTKEKKSIFDDFIMEKINVYTTQKTKFLISMFLKINVAYRDQINTINRNVRIKRENVAKVTDKDIVDFVNWEGVLNDFMSSLVPASGIYKILLTKKYLNFLKEEQDLVEDLLLSNDEAVDICKTSVKIIVNIRESFSALMTNKLNKTIKLLTAITVVLTLPTMVASIYGMNIGLPLQNQADAFLFVMGGTFLLSLITFLIFYKKDWM